MSEMFCTWEFPSQEEAWKGQTPRGKGHRVGDAALAQPWVSHLASLGLCLLSCKVKAL